MLKIYFFNVLIEDSLNNVFEIKKLGIINKYIALYKTWVEHFKTILIIIYLELSGIGYAVYSSLFKHSYD